MTNTEVIPLAPTAAKFWALGDYQRIAEVIAGLGPELVSAGQIAPGEAVLDVGAGTGNATLPAARAGAGVTAVDICPALLAVGEQTARLEGLDIHWIEGDVENLPFPDGSFDVVLSCVGAMFAPDQQATARELVRVCRPGGRIVMANWTPAGTAGEFFRLLGRFDPPPPDAPSPTTWGEPAHVRRLLGAGCEVFAEVRSVRARFAGSTEEFVALYRTHFAPVIAAYAAQQGDPGRIAALDVALTDFGRRENRARPGAAGHYEYEYLLVRARRRGPQVSEVTLR